VLISLVVLLVAVARSLLDNRRLDPPLPPPLAGGGLGSAPASASPAPASLLPKSAILYVFSSTVFSNVSRSSAVFDVDTYNYAIETLLLAVYSALESSLPEFPPELYIFSFTFYSNLLSSPAF
jgi:hypothetical protein